MSAISAQDLDTSGSRMFSQAMWFLLHALFGLLAWGAFMLAVTFLLQTSALSDVAIPPAFTLGMSFAVPLAAGFIFMKKQPSNVATLTWLAGLVWFMIVGLWILDMPTGPNACYHCGASQKLWLTFFSLSVDSGLIEGQGRLLGTWPTLAMIGYSIGAKFAMRDVEMEPVAE